MLHIRFLAGMLEQLATYLHSHPIFPIKEEDRGGLFPLKGEYSCQDTNI